MSHQLLQNVCGGVNLVARRHLHANKAKKSINIDGKMSKKRQKRGGKERGKNVSQREKTKKKVELIYSP